MVAAQGHPKDGDGSRHRAALREQQRLDLLNLRHGQWAQAPARAAERDDLGLLPHHDASAKDQVITVPVGSAKQEKLNSGMTKSSSLVCSESFDAVQSVELQRHRLALEGREEPAPRTSAWCR